MNGTSWDAFDRAARRAEEHPEDALQRQRVGVRGDPVPDAEYGDDHHLPAHVERPDTCDLCDEVPPEYEAEVAFESGPTVDLDLCTGCRIHVEDAGEVSR